MASPGTMVKTAFLANVLLESLDLLCENDASGNPIYIGRAEVGSLATAAKWQIKKLTYDANNSVTESRYADSTASFSKVWDDRASYDYTP